MGNLLKEFRKSSFVLIVGACGTTPDPVWTLSRAKYCLICGNVLLNSCQKCQEPLMSFKHKFCPNCGTPYTKKNK